jgi:hypothetical protein
MVKRLLAVLLLLTISMLVVSPAGADWLNPVVKWDQSATDPWGSPSWYDPNGSALTADDFPCTSPDPIKEITFAGFSNGGVLQGFRVTFWSDFPATPNDASHPDTQMKEAMVGPADLVNDPLKLGWQVTSVDAIGIVQFKINLPAADWFGQQGSQQTPMVYWLGIQGVGGPDEYQNPFSFYWAFKDRNQSTWGDDAAFQGDAFFPPIPPWSNWAWPVEAQPEADPDLHVGPDLYDGPLSAEYWKSADMAFTVSTAVPEPGTLALLACGGLMALLVWRRRK